MRNAAILGMLAVAVVVIAGCESITVTANTMVRSTARIADATTNGTDAVSDATSNTVHNIDARNYRARLHFVDSQMPMLRREAARGEGENLDALAYLMHVKNVSAFEEHVQKNYQTLFHGSPDAAKFLARLSDTVSRPAIVKRSAPR